MPIGMMVEANIKSPRNERVPTASIDDITYPERQSFLRGENRHHAQRAQRKLSTGQRGCWRGKIR